MRSRIILGVFVSAIALVAGCSQPPAPAPSTQAPAKPPRGLEREAEKPVPVAAMSIERKREALPDGFPFQVPVVDGRVIRALEQDRGGHGVWLYDIEVKAEPADVVAWYQSIYTAAEWQLVDKAEETQGGRRAVRLRLVKGTGAQSVVRVVDEGHGLTAVSGSIGLGVAVNDVY